MRMQFRAAAAVLASTSLGTAQELRWEFYGSHDDEEYGSAVASNGDVDGDGVPDVIAGAPRYQVKDGRFEVYSGRTGQLLYEEKGEKDDLLGSSAVFLADFDVDGNQEFAVAAFGPAIAEVTIYSGGSFAKLRTHIGEDPGDLFGFSMDRVPDIDGDGVDDYFVAGIAYAKLYSGATGNELSRTGFGLTGPAAVVVPGDLNNDGHLDFVTGEPSKTSNGRVRGIDGRSGGTLYEIQGPTDGSRFGHALALMGDFTGDGIPEVVAGAPDGFHPDDCDWDVGWARVLSGADGAILYEIHGEVTGRLGHSLAGLGDLTGDGVPDFAVGDLQARHESPTCTGLCGAVGFYSGADGELFYRLTGAPGASPDALAYAGDIDQDGLPDLLIGSIFESDQDGIQPGGAFVYAGNDLYLHASTQRFDPIFDDDLALTSGKGLPGNPTMLFLISVDGGHYCRPLAFGSFDATGSFTLEGPVPPSLHGHTLGFLAFALHANGHIADSIQVEVLFED